MISKSFEIQLPDKWIIWHPSATQTSVINLTSMNPKSVQNYLIVDSSLDVKAYHHGTPVILSVKVVNDIRQINTLIQELVNYRVDAIEIG